MLQNSEFKYINSTFKLVDFYYCLDNYTDPTLLKFNKNIAYFDPFIFLDDRFSQGFTNLVDYCQSIHDELIYNFLNLLNKLQYNAVVTQQKNLMNDLRHITGIDRNKPRKFTIKEYIDNYIFYLKVYNEKLAYGKEKEVKVLEVMSQNATNINYKNINIKDFGFDELNSEEEQKIAKNVLANLLIDMNKNSFYSLKSNYDIFIKYIEDYFKSKDIHLGMEHKYFIRDVIGYIITGNIKFDNKNKNKFLDNKTFYNSI